MRPPVFLLLISYLPVLLVCLPIVHAVTNKGSATQAFCSTLSAWSQCRGSVPIPEFKVGTGRILIGWKPNPCKSRITYSIFGKKGWTCRPGWDEVYITGPTSLDISIRSISICDLIRKNVPAFTQIVQKTGAICSCLPQILSVLDADGVEALAQSKSVGGASATLLQKFADFSSCAATHGFNIQENKARLTQSGGVLVETDNIRIFKAAELDLSRYLAFAGALAPCFSPVGCQPEAVKGFFEKYLTDSENLMLDQVRATFKPWTEGFTNIESSFSSLANSAKSVGDKVNSIQAQATTILNEFCPNPATCANNSLTEFKAGVESALDLSKQIAQINSVLATGAADAKAVVTVVTTASKAFDAIGDLNINGIFAKVVNGQFRSIEDFGGALRVAQSLPGVVTDLQNKLPQLQKSVTQVVDIGPKFVTNLQLVLSRNWVAGYRGNTPSTAKLTDGVSKLQQSFAELIPQGNAVYAGVDYLNKVLVSVSNPGTVGGVSVAVASYSRWTSGYFDAVCVSIAKQSLTIPLLKITKKIEYPELCPQGYMVNFPNHHIPYIKLELSKDSSLAKFAQNVRGATTSIAFTTGTQSVAGILPGSASSLQPSPSSGSSSSVSATSNNAVTTSTPAAMRSSSSSVPTASSSSTFSTTTTSSPTSQTPISSANSPSSARPTGTNAPTRRAILFGRPLRPRQSQSGNAPDNAPDTTETIEVPNVSGLYTDSSSALVAASSAAPPPTQIFVETVISGTTTTAPISETPTGVPVSTETQPNPSDITVSAKSVTAVYADLSATTGGETLTVSELRTFSVNTAEPTIAPATTSAAPTSVAPSPSTTSSRSRAPKVATLDVRSWSWVGAGMIAV